MEADAGHYVDHRGTSLAAATDNINRFANPDRFQRANSVQAGTDWLFGGAISVLQVSHHVC